MSESHARKSATFSAAGFPVERRKTVSFSPFHTRQENTITREFERMGVDLLMRARRPVVPDPVDEVLLRKDELQSVLFRVFGQLATGFCEGPA